MADTAPDQHKGGRASQTVCFPFWPRPLLRRDWFSMGLFIASFASLQVALKADLIQVQKVPNGAKPRWRAVVNPSITYVLLGLYIIQVVFFISTIIWLWGRNTGIRHGWDPTNLADTIALFSTFNIQMEDLELSDSRNVETQFFNGQNFRLGYWSVTHRNTESICYGIRSLDPSQRTANKPANSHSRARHRARLPYTERPMMHTWVCTIYIVFGALCLIGCISIAGTKLFSRTIVIHGNFIDIFNTSSATQFNFTTDLPLYGNLPTGAVDGVGNSYDLVIWSGVLRSGPLFVIGMVIGQLAIYDYHHRWSQPLLNMYRGPEVADRTILLDYMTPSTMGVMTRAWEHDDWKVFYYALLNKLVPLLRLLPVGVLGMINTGSGIYCEFSLTFLIATILMLTVVTGSQLGALRSKRRMFPRGGTSLLDVWLLCFRSHLARNPEFSECGPLWTKEDLSSTLHLRHDKYILGALSDDEEDAKMGFDIAEKWRESFPTSFVFYVDPRTHERSDRNPVVDSKDKDKGKGPLLSNYYSKRKEPINIKRSFEIEISKRDAAQDAQHSGQ
ncbi:hypothetical protein PG987_000564 [Apiospora arundinis]